MNDAREKELELENSLSNMNEASTSTVETMRMSNAKREKEHATEDKNIEKATIDMVNNIIMEFLF